MLSVAFFKIPVSLADMVLKFMPFNLSTAWVRGTLAIEWLNKLHKQLLIIWLKNGPYAQHMYINCRKVLRWGWSLSFVFLEAYASN